MKEYYNLLTEEIIERCQLKPSIEENFNWIKSQPSNKGGKDSIQWIAHYMDVLKKYSDEGDISVEFGLNQVNSTWALLNSKAKIIHSVDIDVHGKPSRAIGTGKNIWAIQAHKLAWESGKEYYIQCANSLDVRFEKIDFLFIDTVHNAAQLSRELNIHAPVVTKYIAIHDTKLFKDAYGTAIKDFLDKGEWEIELELNDNPGLTILKRK